MIIDYEPPKIIEIIDKQIVYMDFSVSGLGMLRLPIVNADRDEMIGGIYEPEPEPEPDPEEGE